MKLALTGGPSGGKTTFTQAMQKEFTGLISVVPEAASIVFGGGWPRRKTVDGVRHQQVAIYYVQRELEALLEHEVRTQAKGGKLLVCDRGSLDGLAYWPTPHPEEFLSLIGSSIAVETARYNWVIHLDTAPASYYDDGNPLRNESFEEAWALNEKIKLAWAGHPQRIVIANHESGHFIDKMQRALTVVRMILAGRAFGEIVRHLESLQRVEFKG